MMLTFGMRLRKARHAKGYTQKQLASLIGVKNTSISNWEKDQNRPDPDNIELLCGALNISANDLLPSTRLKDENWAEPLVDAYATAPDLTQRSVCNVLEIPHVKPWGDDEVEDDDEVDLFDYCSAAGSGNYIDSDSRQTISLPAGTVPSDADCGVRISGRSMEPDIKDGDIVWVHQTCEILNHQVGIFIINGDNAVCKRAKLDEHGQLVRLMSDNPSIPDIELEDMEEMRVFGHVIGSYTP